MGRKYNSMEQANMLNNISYGIWFTNFYNLCLSRYKWNLPSEVPPYYVEKTLFWEGEGAFFEDDVINKYGFLPFNEGYVKNIYGNPKTWFCISEQGYRFKCDNKNSVICYNNYTHSPDCLTVKYYAEKISKIDRIIDINVNAQKQPLIFKTDNKTRLSILNLYEQYDGNIPIVITSKNDLVDGIEVVNTKAEFNCDKLYSLKKMLINECLTKLGIENNVSEKTEREVSVEAVSNLGVVESYRNTGLISRQRFCEKVNKKFNLHTGCEYNSNLFLNKIGDAQIWQNTL